jgi:hypothetical protein
MRQFRARLRLSIPGTHRVLVREIGMRREHGSCVCEGMALFPASSHCLRVVNLEGSTQMFVRAVWRTRRLIDIKQTFRELDVPTTRQAENLGIVGAEFSKMTRGLFDR